MSTLSEVCRYTRFIMIQIVKYLIARPLISNLIIFFILFLAFASTGNIQRGGLPRVDLKTMVITTIFPGASPEDVELNVTVKIEEALEEVDGIEEFKSTSLENQSIIEVKIDPDNEDPEKVKAEIRRAVEDVSDLPDELENDPDIHEVKVDNWPVYEIALVSTKASKAELRKHALALKKQLLKIESVSRVLEQSIPDREIKILLDKQKMAAHYISFDEVIDSIRLNKLRVSGGSLESYTSKKGIVTFSEFETPEEIGKIYVRASDLGFAVQIKDIAVVKDGLEDTDTIIRYNGQPGLSVFAVKKGTADVISTVDEILESIKEYESKSLPKYINTVSTFDASIDTKSRLSTVYSNAIIGFILVLAVLFLFLEFRVALWTAVGIPLSIAVAFILIPIFDITLNSISLLGIIVVLGMLVDDAIIIAESIYRSKENGMPVKKAAIHGLQQVMRPVFATVATTIIAFIPMYFVPGMAGDFSIEIPSLVIIMLLASLLESTLLLPGHLAHGKDSKKHRAPVGQKMVTYLEKLYRKLLTVMLNHSVTSAIIITVVFLLLFITGASIVKFKMFPVDQATRMYFYGETAADKSLEFTSDQVKKIEAIIRELPRDVLHSFKSTIGSKFNAGGPSLQAANVFFIQLELTPASDREMKSTDIQRFVINAVKQRGINSFDKIDYYIDSGGPPAGKPVEIRITGNNKEKGLVLIKDLQERLKKYPLTEIDSDYREGKFEARLLPHYKNIATAQLSVAQIASTIRTAFDGVIVTELQTNEESIPFRVMLDDHSVNFDNPLAGLMIRNNLGIMVPVENLVQITRSQAAENIYHFNGQRTYTITANIDETRTTTDKIYNDIQPLLNELEKKYEGFEFTFSGEVEKDVETRNNMMKAVIGAIIAIYFLLVISFNSFTQPVLVLLAVPFGLIGVLFAFSFQGMDLSMMAMTGILGFSGVVINDSLVMVEFINRLKKENRTQSQGIQSNHPIIEGSIYRLRPIILTTLSTLAGLIPTAYGFIGGIDSFVSPMVMAMTWGLFTGTVSVLFVIPLLYLLNEKVTRRIKGLFKHRTE